MARLESLDDKINAVVVIGVGTAFMVLSDFMEGFSVILKFAGGLFVFLGFLIFQEGDNKANVVKDARR